MAGLPWLFRTRFWAHEILPIAEENKYLGKFSYLIMELYVVCTHKNPNEYTQHTFIVLKIEKQSLNYRYLLPACHD